MDRSRGESSRKLTGVWQGVYDYPAGGGSAVRFVKTYDGSKPNYTTVVYEGTVSADATEIEGRWRIPRSWSGKFLMIRSGEQPAEAEERKGVAVPAGTGPKLVPAGER